MQSRLIEEESVEHLRLFAEVSEEARAEKLGGRPAINEILYWWTRKPLIVSRAVTLLSLAPSSVSIEAVKSLLGLGREKRAFNYTPSKASLEKTVDKDLNTLKILDPFAGSGNLLFEASRLGLDCTLLEYNPVAYLITKAVLEYPAIYGEKLAEDVKNYGEEVIRRAKEQLGKFYERNGRRALHYLWCWCIKCPYCGQRVPLTNQMWLDKKRKIGYKIIPTENKDFTVEIGIVDEREGSKYTQKGGRAVCIKCGNAISYEQMMRDIAERRDKEMIVIVVKARKGKDYELPTQEDIDNVIQAHNSLLKEKWQIFQNEWLIPFENVRESKRDSNLSGYGIVKWFKFFTERQLLLMSTLLKLIREVCAEIKKDREYAKAIATYLGFLLCKHVDRNCIGTSWDTSYQKISHALTFRSPRIIYNFAETNPFEETSGSLKGILKDVVEAVKFAATNKRVAKTLLGSSLHLKEIFSEKYDLIITDPPYLDDVAYAELSEFFYVWLIRVLKDYYPELPERMPVEEDLVLSKGRFGGDKDLAMEFYKRGMKVSFRNIRDVLKDDGLLVVFFAHSSTEAWNLLLDILRESGFRVTSSYTVHTESTENPLARGKTSFMSSIVLACRKVLDEKEAYFEGLLPRVEDGIKNLIEGLGVDDLLAIPITDLLIMSYGKVLEELTQYTSIKSYRADFKPDFETLVGEARDFIFREMVRKLTGSSPNILGPEASFALIGKIFYRSLIPADEALKLTRAYGLKVETLTKSGYVKKARGRILINPFTEVELDLRPEEVDRNNVYQQLLYLEKTAYEQGATKANALLKLGNFRPREISSLISLVIKHYRLLANKGEKLEEDEREELRVLEALADVMIEPITQRGATLDAYT